MLSSELAGLVGVTVRTLRHYHQIGLLPEPPRSAGGYRHYDVSHVVRLLRITRMTALGVPLADLPALLDDSAAADELLDELDRDAAAEMERLGARRATIAALRRSGAPPDLLPEFAAWLSGPATDVPEDMARYEHETLVLVAHLLGEDGADRLTSLFGDAERTQAASAPLTARFYALEADTPNDTVARLIDDLVDHLEPLAARLTGESPFDEQAEALLDELCEQTLKPVQHRVLRQVDQRLVQPRSR